MKIEEAINILKKKGQCPDCNKKADKCKCDFKELYITIKINDIKKIFEAGMEYDKTSHKTKKQGNGK